MKTALCTPENMKHNFSGRCNALHVPSWEKLSAQSADSEAVAAPDDQGDGHRKHRQQNHKADVGILQWGQVSHEHWRLERLQWCRTCRWSHCFDSPGHFNRCHEAKWEREDVAARCQAQQRCQGRAAGSGHVLSKTSFLVPARTPQIQPSSYARLVAGLNQRLAECQMAAVSPQLWSGHQQSMITATFLTPAVWVICC